MGLAVPVAGLEALCGFGLVVLGRYARPELAVLLKTFSPVEDFFEVGRWGDCQLSWWFLSATKGSANEKPAHVETC